MTTLCQILLVSLLAISVESIWPWPRQHNNIEHPLIRLLQPQDFFPTLRLNKNPNYDIFEKFLQDEISNYNIIIKVKKYPRYYTRNEEFFPGFSPADVEWLNSILDDIDSDGNTGNDHVDDVNGLVNEVTNHSGGVDHEVGNTNDDAISKPHSNGNNKVSNEIEGTDNQKPFTNIGKPENADEDLKIDPRKDEEESKKKEAKIIA